VNETLAGAKPPKLARCCLNNSSTLKSFSKRRRLFLHSGTFVLHLSPHLHFASTGSAYTPPKTETERSVPLGLSPPAAHTSPPLRPLHTKLPLRRNRFCPRSAKSLACFRADGYYLHNTLVADTAASVSKSLTRKSPPKSATEHATLHSNMASSMPPVPAKDDVNAT
jgi:hypothetical protein